MASMNMLSSIKMSAVIALTSALLAGCASNTTEQRQLELLASNRASLLMSELPLERGALNIVRTSAHANTIEIMMIYNQDAAGAQPIQQILNRSIQSYCSNSSVAANMELGIDYRIKMRNSRGQLMVDQIINRETCQTLTPSAN